MKVRKVDFRQVKSKKKSSTECIITLEHTPNILLGDIVAVECNDEIRFFEVFTITLEYDEAFEVGYFAKLLTKGTLEEAVSKVQNCTFRMATEEERRSAKEKSYWC